MKNISLQHFCNTLCCNIVLSKGNKPINKDKITEENKMTMKRFKEMVMNFIQRMADAAAMNEESFYMQMA